LNNGIRTLLMSRITICGVLEDGYESTMEHLVWRQLKGAFGVKLLLAPKDFPTMQDLVDSLEGKRVFFIPPGRMESLDFYDYKLPEGEVNLIFGKPGDNLVKYVREEDDVVSIHTPNSTDMMAVSTVGIALNRYNEHR